MHPIEKTCSPTHADIVAGKEMGRRNTGGENENGTTGSSHIPLRTWRENAETTMFQVIQVPFFPLDFSHLGAAWRWPTGRRVLRKGEGGSHLSAHTHLGACKPSTDFAKSGSLWLVRSGEVERISISFTKWQALEKVLRLQRYHILKMKNQPFGALVGRKIDGLPSSKDTGGLEIMSREHHTVHYVLRYCPFLDLGVSIFYRRMGIEKSHSCIRSHPFYISNPFSD